MTTRIVNSSQIQASDTALPQSQSLFMAVTWTFAAMMLGDQTYIASTPLAVLYLVAHGTPFLMMTALYLRRRFSPGKHIPARWPEGFTLQRRLTVLQFVILATAFLFCLTSLVEHHIAGHTRHAPQVTLPNDAYWFLLGWNYVLQTYIADRRPLPPAGQAPSANWQDSKPIHSEYWGTRTNVA